jgi:uncharacterized YigZ family protein
LRQTEHNGSESDLYKTIRDPSEGLFKDRGSKFISYAFPVQNEEEVKTHIRKLKKDHHSARHHCYAFRIGTKEHHYRVNDDGEPSGTAGKPVYGQLLSYDLTNILIVVVRYFGGTLLGTSGLIHAYRSAAEDCLQHADIIERTVEKKLRLSFTYEQMSQVMHIIKEEGLIVENQDFREDCRIEVNVRESWIPAMRERFGQIPGLIIEQ